MMTICRTTRQRSFIVQGKRGTSGGGKGGADEEDQTVLPQHGAQERRDGHAGERADHRCPASPTQLARSTEADGKCRAGGDRAARGPAIPLTQ
jgi:hypothetical protein